MKNTKKNQSIYRDNYFKAPSQDDSTVVFKFSFYNTYILNHIKVLMIPKMSPNKSAHTASKERQ
jgi:hypothetical protein